MTSDHATASAITKSIQKCRASAEIIQRRTPNPHVAMVATALILMLETLEEGMCQTLMDVTDEPEAANAN